MATVALAYTQPRPTFISSHYNYTTGPENWTTLLRVPHGDLPSGTSGEYAIVAFGNIGRTRSSNNSASANVALRFASTPVAHLPTTCTRVWLNSTLYLDGSGANARRAHPFMCMYYVAPGTWPATTDLVLSATTAHGGGTTPPGDFWCDQLTLLVFDYATTSFVWNANATPATLEYVDVGETLLVTGGTLPSAEKWVYFYSTQVSPGTEQDDSNLKYMTWLSRYNDGTTRDTTFGVSGRNQIVGCKGRADRGTPPTPPVTQLEQFCLGGWVPVTTTNTTTSLRIYGTSDYLAASAIHKSLCSSSAMLAVKESSFADAVSANAVAVPNAFNRTAWQSYRTLNVDAGDDRRRFVFLSTSSMWDSSVPTIKSAANYLDVNGGFPAAKFATDALQTTVVENGTDYLPCFASYVAEVEPWIVRHGQNTAQTNGILSPVAGYSADSGGAFYSAFAFCTTNDGDRAPPTMRTISYTSLTLLREVSGAGVPQLPAGLEPDQSYSIELNDGLVSFETEDGHVIRWPSWSSPRRGWRLRWTCDEATYLALWGYLHRPNDTAAIKLPAAFPEAPGTIVYVHPNTLRAQQRSGRLVWEVSCTVTELLYT